MSRPYIGSFALQLIKGTRRIVIFIVLVLIGEVVRVVSAKGRKEEYKGLTPELAAQRLAEEAAEAEEN